MQVIVKGLLIHYEVIGKGKTILVLHGWGDDSRNWKKLQKEFSKAYEVITLDLPGFGASDTPKEDWTLQAYAEFLKDFITKIGVANVYAIIGHSNGGAIAISGLARGVLTSERLVLLASAGIRNEYKGRNKALRYVTKAGKALTAPLPRSTKKKIQRKVYQTIGSDMLVAENLQGTFKNVVQDDVRQDANNITIPTLLIYGEKDASTPLKYGKILQEHIKKSELRVLPNAEHFVYQDKPQETARFIKDFLR